MFIYYLPATAAASCLPPLANGPAGGYNPAMCGFAGEFLFAGSAGRADVGRVRRMAETLRHRGPDEAGEFLSDDGRCAIGFCRLCVIDPPGSHQPMRSADGAVTIAFNGEIYNFRRLREELAAGGHRFVTAGDTEVLLAMYLRDGLGMLGRLEGMFAAAIHDGRDGRLHLIRDRVGVKPLWYAVGGGTVRFASEAKALLASGVLDRTVEIDSLGAYLTLGYIPAPRSIWRGLLKLPPGHHVTFDAAPAEPVRWWEPPSESRPIGRADAVERVREALSAAVAKRLVADVPVGTLLSGGVDSSIVTALMCRATGDARAVKTFSAGFAEADFDERPHAHAVAEHLGTDHRELLIKAPDAEALLTELVARYDEPFGDSSAAAMLLLCRAVRPHVTVALCGDGGDEAFAGYDRHRAMWLAENTSAFKGTLAMGAGMVLDSFAPRNEKSPLRRFVRFARALDAPPALRYLQYRQLFDAAALDGLLTDDLAEQLHLTATRDAFVDLYERGECDSDLLAAQRHDVLSYLPDDLLVKADIASMAASLELRSPMLDTDVLELGLSLPAELKVDRQGGKRILADAFADLLPAEVFTRGKAGFGVPIGEWLRGPLLPALRETLLDQSFIDVGWVKRTAMAKLIDAHAAGKADHRHRLWALLQLARWQAAQ